MNDRKIPAGFYEFVDMTMTDRHIRLVFDDFVSAPFHPPNGCCQGCPLSMTLYGIYNAPLIETAAKANKVLKTKRETIVGFVDDTSAFARAKTFAETYAILKNMMERNNGIFHWSSEYNSPLEMNKLALVNFCLVDAKLQEAGNLTVVQKTMAGNKVHSIPPQPNAKLLGVILDSKLGYRAQQDKVIAKAIQWNSALKRFTKPGSGVSANVARQFFKAVAEPRVTYACDVWYKPPYKETGAKRKTGSVGVAKRLSSFQRQAAISITGAMNTTAGDTAVAHANLTPIEIRMKELGIKAAARIATLPPSHPLHPYSKRTSSRLVKHHRSSLHTLYHLSPFISETLETIQPVRHKIEDQPKFSTRIDSSAEEALKWDEENFSQHVMIYTDGSGYKDNCAGSAVVFVNGVETASLKYRLGPLTEHIVYEGELVGLILGLHLAKEFVGKPRINFSVDNQAAIQGLPNNRSQPAHYLLDEILAGIKRLQPQREANELRQRFTAEATSEISLTWIPGHEGAVGNEAADVLAKDAAENGSSPMAELPTFLHNPLPVSISATRQLIEANCKRETTQQWKESPRYLSTKSIDPKLPSKSFMKLATDADLSRKHTSVLMQLRTGHVPLNKHLFRIGKVDSPFCAHCTDTPEDVQHFLFECPKYTKPRRTLAKIFGRRANLTRFLLADSTAVPHTLRYIHATGRLTHIYGDLTPREQPEE